MKLSFKGSLMALGALSIIFLCAMTTGSVAFASTLTGLAFVGSLIANSPEFKGLAFTIPAVPSFVEKTEMEIKDMSFEELKAYRIAELDYRIAKKQAELQPQLDEINKKIEEGKNVDALKAEISALEDKMNKYIAELNSIGLKMKAAGEGPTGKTATPSVEALLKSNEDKIKKFIAKEIQKFEIEVPKATQTATDITNGTDFAQMLPGVGQLPYKKTYIQQRIRVVGTNTEYIKYLDQATAVRDADNVAACGATTHNTKLTWQTYTLQQQKVRDYVDICIDMMDDYSFVEGEIRNLITTSVMLHIDNQLLLGTGIAPELESIDSTASTFDPALAGADYSGSVGDPTMIDLIVVMGAQIEYLGSNNFWKADTCYINPRDLTLIKLYKDADENYIKSDTIMRVINNVNGNLEIDGIELISNPNVPAGELYVFDSRQATIYKRKNAVIEFSYENATNFETETVTVKAYERLNMLIRNVNANAFMHCDDIATALTDLTSPS